MVIFHSYVSSPEGIHAVSDCGCDCGRGGGDDNRHHYRKPVMVTYCDSGIGEDNDV